MAAPEACGVHVGDVGADRHVHGQRNAQPVRSDGQAFVGVRGFAIG